ncbi:hypothetical protein LNTAR_16618 [Lentisphaera araneosa HTCC2155]|uniref:Cytochrome c domain-containing protein n=1 Tax=Lentisphaera araneosa HTCC2155 TaxID=313628 RepID=A6DQD8_9BACT|nr:c-type cytochrome [Lentisphaera araneosa]EDM26189.1 hypothetical protein LNTAR_16618 [Lentisphaera araneosa HTCC2155]
MIRTTLFLLSTSLISLCFADTIPSPAYPGLKIQKGLEAKVLTRPNDIKSPSSFCLDDQGRFFVTEAWRLGNNGNFGNRKNRYWLLDDNASQSNEDRMAMLKKWQHKNDYTKFNEVSEVVKLLEDYDDDGKADSVKVFADGFNHPLDGNASGVFAGLGKIYFSCIPNIWSLEDHNKDGEADKKVVLQDGFGVRYNFWGHDLNSCILGPDGRLYFTVGDRGFNLKTKEGKVLKDVSSGAVFRMEVDGSDLEIFYHNLRNPKELAFNSSGQLFTVDNNADMGDKARVVYCIEQGDSGWDSGLQFMHSFYSSVYPGDLTGIFKPWNEENMWETEGNVREYHLPPIGFISSGPSGFTYNPGTGLNTQYLDTFFLADYVGGRANCKVHSFKLSPKGASFSMNEAKVFSSGLTVSDLEFGLNGELHLLNYGEGWVRPKDSGIISLRSRESNLKQEAAKVKAVLAKGFNTISSEELANLLSSKDMRIRTRASIELAQRKEISILSKSLKVGDSPKAMHATWGLGIVARLEKNSKATFALVEALKHSEAQVRNVAVSCLGDIGYLFKLEEIKALLNDASPYVQTSIAIALSKIHNSGMVELIIEQIRTNSELDPFQRHSYVMALTSASEDKLVSYSKDELSSVRMVILLALARKNSAKMALYLQDPSLDLREEAILLIKKSALNNLKKLAADELVSNDVHLFNDLTVSRLINLNNQLGTDKNVENIMQFLLSSRTSQRQKLIAVDIINNWNKPKKIDKSNGLYYDLGVRTLPNIRTQLRTIIFKHFTDSDELLQVEFLKLAQRFKIDLPNKLLADVLRNSKINENTRISALHLVAKDSSYLPTIKNLARANNLLALEAIMVIASNDSPLAAEEFKRLLQEAEPRVLQKSLEMVELLPSNVAKNLIHEVFSRFEEGTFPEEAQLELFRLADKYGMNKSVTDFRNKSSLNDDIKEFMECLEGGSVDKGKSLFNSHPTAQCLRCHTVNSVGGDAGPDLSQIARKFDSTYLLQSLVEPGAKIASGYGIINLTLKSGDHLSGILMKETPNYLSIKIGDELRKINRMDIETSQKPISTMPPMKFLLKKHELRDILAYLKTLKKLKKLNKH